LEFDEDSIEGIWQSLKQWDDYQEGFPGFRERFGPESHQQKLEWARHAIAAFDSRVLAAVHGRDIHYLQKLLKAIQATEYPRPDIHGVIAASDLGPGSERALFL
jgi:hypothetical protein